MGSVGDLDVPVLQLKCLLRCRLAIPWEYCLIGFTSRGHFVGSSRWSPCTRHTSLPSSALLSAVRTSPQTQPEPRMEEGFSRCVGFSSSEAQGHLHTLSLWNGPLVADPGRAQWCLYQPVKRDSPGLHQVPLSQSNSPQSTDGCSFTRDLATMFSPPISWNKLPLEGSEPQFNPTSVLATNS